MGRRRKDTRTGTLPNLVLTQENLKGLRPGMERIMSRRQGLLVALMKNPAQVYANSASVMHLRALLTSEERRDAIRGHLKQVVTRSLQDPNRLRREKHYFIDRRRMDALAKKVETLGEEELIQLLNINQTLTGKRFENRILNWRTKPKSESQSQFVFK